MEPIAPGDHVAVEHLLHVAFAISNPRLRRLEILHADVVHVEQQSLPIGDRGGDQILDHLMLPVHGDRAAASESGEIDAMVATVEPQMNASMHEPLAAHPLTHPDCLQQIRRVVLEHPRTHALLAVRPAA